MHQSGKAGDEAKKRKSPSAPKAGELASGKFSFTLFFVRATKTLLREQKKKKKKERKEKKKIPVPRVADSHPMLSPRTEPKGTTSMSE